MDARIAFAIYSELPNLIAGDQLAAAALKARGLTVEPALWQDPMIDWSQYSAVVIRSCWDYHQRAAEFSAWLAHLQSLQVALWNPVEVVRWNMDKMYLSDLAQQGINVLPSVWLPRGAKVHLRELMAEKKWSQVVIKPVISAAADQTYLISLDSAEDHQSVAAGLLQQGGLIVQEYASEIESDGEWSFMFFGSQYSHAVLKRPSPGDFRVQPHLGGTLIPADPGPSLIRQAAAIAAAVEADLLYARVDAIERAGQLLLMELELIEPDLFFTEHPQATARFADAFEELMAMKE